MNHIVVEQAEEAPEVVLSEYLVNSTIATVLFDSRASHEFISSRFVLKNHIPKTALKKPLLTQSSGAMITYRYGCMGVEIILSGVSFRAHLVVLDTQGVDVILGMNWLAKHKGNIASEDRTVTVINRQGILVICNPTKRKG